MVLYLSVQTTTSFRKTTFFSTEYLLFTVLPIHRLGQARRNSSVFFVLSIKYPLQRTTLLLTFFLHYLPRPRQLSMIQPSSVSPRFLYKSGRKETAYIYVDLVLTMCYAEMSYDYMVTKSVLEATNSPVRSKLQILASCTSNTSLVGILRP